MGLQGHSFGGFETEYIVAHSKLFAAACSGSGWSDAITAYSALMIHEGDRHVSRQYMYEIGREDIGATMWHRPDLYIENSAVLYANKISTPLLKMNNKEDYDVFFFSGSELYTALRRLGKPVWMLQYDGEGHSLFKESSVIDYNTRMNQFFDYYLKGAPPPMWMTRGVPAKLKQIDSGLELDNSGAKP